MSKSYINFAKKSKSTFCKILSQDPATAMYCCAKGSSSVSISGHGGAERLKAQAEAAVRNLENNNNNNNNKVILYIVIKKTNAS